VLDAFASERQYLDHLAPIWAALDPAERGRFHLPSTLVERAVALGVDAAHIALVRPRRGGLIMVAAASDYRMTSDRPVVYVEHGAGQTYVDDTGHPCYSGGDGFDRVVLFLCPNETVAERWRAKYRAPAEVVGCPKLDRFFELRTSKFHNVGNSPTVAVSFHWEQVSRLPAPEARGAWSHYDAVLPALAAEFRVLGHGHPRLWGRISRRWKALGVTPAEHFDQVLDEADIYVCDNSSTLFEFAATGRPVVVLNAPWFRRDVEHGLRFWEHAGVGVQVNEPGELVPAIRTALADLPHQREARERAVRAVYGVLDGRASERAVAAIRKTPAGAVQPASRAMNPYAPRTPPRALTGVVQPPIDITAVPRGSVREVLAWVGDDRDRAIAAQIVEAERPEAQRRKTLFDRLRQIADG
jgi:hypothetical protein